MFVNLSGIEIGIIQYLQSTLPFTRELMLGFTYLGYGPVYLILMSFVFWCVNERLGLRLGLLVSLAGAVTEILKFTFHAPRPFWLDTSIQAYTADISFGMPSGHALAGLAFWGLWAFSAKGKRRKGLLIGLAFMIGASRVQLGVHFPTQVLCGWLVALVLLIAFLYLEEPLSGFFKARGVLIGLITVLAAGAVLMGLGLVVLMGLDSWALPTEWVQKAGSAKPRQALLDPLNPTSLVINSTLLAGIGMSAVLSRGNLWGGAGKLPGGTVLSRIIYWLAALAGAGLIVLVFTGPSRFVQGSGLIRLALYGGAGLAAGIWLFWAGPRLAQRLRGSA